MKTRSFFQAPPGILDFVSKCMVKRFHEFLPRLTLDPGPGLILGVGGLMQEDERFLIGELAEQAGVNRETLRYYERRGLLNPARRTASGYRVYDRESAARLLFIKRAQAFGFSLDEIRDLLRMKPETPQSCNRVMKMLDGKIEESTERIREMQRFRRQLTRYRKQCREALAEGECCPVILEISHPHESERVRNCS